MQKLKRRFGEQNCSENVPEFGCYGLPPHEANAHIDWINIDHIHACEIVEKTLNNFLLVTKTRLWPFSSPPDSRKMAAQ
jgi:hypothetical protein